MKHSWLSSSFSPIERAACSLYTCGAAGIFSICCLSAPSSVFTTTRRIQTVQCAMERQTKPVNLAVSLRGCHLARVTSCTACIYAFAPVTKHGCVEDATQNTSQNWGVCLAWERPSWTHSCLPGRWESWEEDGHPPCWLFVASFSLDVLTEP